MSNQAEPRSLRTILFIGFTLISAIPVLVLATWFQRATLQNEYDAVSEKHLIIAESLAGSIERYAKDLKHGFLIAASTIESNEVSPEVFQFLNKLHLHQAWIFPDTAENPVLHMSFESPFGDNAFPESVATHYEENKNLIRSPANGVYVSGVLPREGGSPFLAVFTRLDLDSYLVGLVSPTYIQEVQRSISFGKNGHAAIVDQQGKIIAHPIDDWVAGMKDLSSLDPVKAILDGAGGTSENYSSAINEEMVSGQALVNGLGWGVMIPQPVAELERNANELNLIALFIAVSGMAVAVFVSWCVANVFTRPLNNIVSYTESVAAGSFERYEGASRRHIPRELTKLLFSLENMVQSLLTKTNDLVETGNRLREAQKIARLGNWQINVTTGCMWCSDEVYSLLGISERNDTGDLNISDCVVLYEKFLNKFSDEERSLFLECLDQTVVFSEPRSIEQVITNSAGESIHVRQKVVLGDSDAKDGIVCMGTIQDITERRSFEDALVRQAHYDSLTGLPNRSLCVDRLEQSISKAKRNSTHVPLLVVGLDHFVEVNDTMGHLAGDEVLCLAAQRIKTVIRESDTLARLGSDEFAVIVEDMSDTMSVPVVTQKIIDSFKAPFFIDGTEMSVGASVGISVFPQDSSSALGLLQKADTALQAAKSSGRNAVSLFTAEMNAAVKSRMVLRSDLACALDNDEFHLVFQPIVDSKTGVIVSSEALLRWSHPEKGFIPPDVFIPIAEEAGYIEDIGLWVIDRSIAQLAEWRSLGYTDLKISINLSLRQIQLGLTPKQILNLLEKHVVPANRLTLEVTESMLADDVNQTKDWMLELTEKGIQFSIDDFGTGYSSLSYLLSLPVSTIKIDRCFVSNLLHGSKDQTLVSAIIALSQKLGFDVVAEGVEEEGELAKLLEYRCEYIQGYYFSKPLLPEEFQKRLGNEIVPRLNKAS
ncbi:MAG: EAL domain-containing protein [Granulosicoccus sp.]